MRVFATISALFLVSYVNSETRGNYDTYGISVNSKNLTNENISLLSQSEDISFCVKWQYRSKYRIE